MRRFLYAGVIITGYPKAALLVAIAVGVLGVFVGGLAYVVHEKDNEDIERMVYNVGRAARCVCSSDSRTIRLVARKCDP